MNRTSVQTTTGISDPPARCPLCGRKTPRCKWCFKGGLGDPPCPEMASWETWQRGLVRVLRRELQRAGMNAAIEQQTIDAVFFDRGDVPPECEFIAHPYLSRLCSIGRYNAGRAHALLVRRVHMALRDSFIPANTESFEERMARMRRLSRDELIEQARKDEAEKHRLQALSWHLEDLACISVIALMQLRRAGVTIEQRSALEVTQMVVDRVGVDASRRIVREHWERIAAGVVADELQKRNLRARVSIDAQPTRLRVADLLPDMTALAVDHNELDILADEDARASVEADEHRVRVRAKR